MATDKVVVDIITNSDKSKASVLKYAAAAGAAAVAIGAIVKVSKELMDTYAVQEQAEARLAATIKATGSAAGLTKIELTKMASGLQDVTKFGDESIIGAESLLLTFKNIGEDTFPRALESILDVSEAMGTDLKASSIQLGKALNDPVGGIAALTRVGIQFTDEQKDTIKAMVEMNDTAGAQNVILNELESQFGGVARAAAETSTGVGIQLNNSFGDLKETLGGVISEGLVPYRKELMREIESVNNSIKAHLLRKKAVAGTATAIEELTLREIEQQKTADHLSQAQTNLALAEERLSEAVASGDQRQQQRVAGLARGIEVAKNTVTGLQDELTLRKLSTETAQKQFDSEQALLDVKLASFEVIESLNEAGDIENENKLEGIALNEELFATEESMNLMIIQRQEERDILTSRALNGIEQEKEAIAELGMDYEALTGTMITSFASAFKEVGAGNATLWEGMKDGAMDAISNILEAFAAQWIVQAIASAAALNFVSAAGYTAAAAGAYAASGLVQSFATGGSFIADSPQLIQVGEGAGSEKVTVEQANGSSGVSERVFASVDGGEGFWMTIQRGLDNRNIRVPNRSIVS